VEIFSGGHFQIGRACLRRPQNALKKTNDPYKPVKPCKPGRMPQFPRLSTHPSTIQTRAMTDEGLIALVQEYFAGVDSQDINRVLSIQTAAPNETKRPSDDE
jgi:hypothetical protein